MCGIAGIVNLSEPSAIDPYIVRRMADAITHRGPDDDGYFFRPGLGMANRRLSIVGLADGKQPITNEDRTVSVVFNGELFDYPEVKARLQSNGHQLRTHCDTELIPHLYEDHGEAVFEKLRGQFAIALWDERKKQLLLARDRFGICPLYWTQQGEFLLFASEIKALLASGLVAAKADPRGINHVFTFFATPGPVTCFAGVNCLLPGRYLRILPSPSGRGAGGEGRGHNTLTPDPSPRGRGEQIQERVYWEIDFPDAGQEEMRGFSRFGSNAHSAVIDEFEAIMKRAVERRLRADVPVVSYLSGGVDSSVVVALACAQRRSEGKGPIPTFTISVQDDPSLNEKTEAHQVAQHLGCEEIVVDCGRQEVLDTYPELIRGAECPVIDTSCAALLMLARKVHERGYKVALTGEGADEWLAGYPWYKIHRLLGMLDIIPGLPMSGLARRAYLKLTGAPKIATEIMQFAQDAIGGDNAWLNIYGLFSSAKMRFFSAGMWEQLGDHLPYDDLKLNLDRAKKWHPLNRSLYLGARVMLPGLLLASKGDRVAMKSSVETRYPFLDEEVFAFLARLHPNWKMHGLRDKLILRHLANRWVPRSIAWRRKAMFRAPLDGFHTTTLPTFVDELLSPESLKKTGYFDAVAVQHWRGTFKTMRGNQRTMVEMGLVGVVATQLWHHTYLGGGLADLPAFSFSAARRWPRRDEWRRRRATRALNVNMYGKSKGSTMSYALSTLWYERQRYLPAVLAVAFSCLLIALQCGLLLGLFSITSIPIDESRADIWVGHPDVPSVDLGIPIPEAWQSYLEMPEVERTEPYMEGFAYWRKPTGGIELVLIIGTRLGPNAIGAIKQLTPEHRMMLSLPNAVVIDQGEFDRLGIQKVGDSAEIMGRRVLVVGSVSGLRSLAGPYLFCSIDTARNILRPPADQCTFLLAKCHRKEDAPLVVEKLKIFKVGDKEKLSPFTTDDFSYHSRMHWLLKTKAGIALGLAAALGLLVGAVVTSQTLYSATVASLKEYAVLRALGIPRWRMSFMVLAQSFWVGIAGIAVAVPTIFLIAYVGGEVGAKILLPLKLLVASCAITMTMAMLSGLLALRSLRLVEPVTLLR